MNKNEAKENGRKIAVIVGGSNGIGLAVAKVFCNNGYHACIIDKDLPDDSLKMLSANYTYYQSDLSDFDESLFRLLSNDHTVEALVITAGFGRVADFEYLHISEIEKLISVNTTAGLKIISLFYDRIQSVHKRFFTVMMGSIAGMLSSPALSVYAATKAAICRFTESINIELEIKGTNNRILNVSPGAVFGTRFYGCDNKPEMLEGLAKCIYEQMINSATVFIPEYDSVYKSVLERYSADPHLYGIESYKYKINSGRLVNERKVKFGYLSGTFDLFHVGHLNLLRRAKSMCDYLIVGVHPNAAHKGKETFIPFEERKQIVASCRYVDAVVDSFQEDSDAWEAFHFDRLFVGSDYKGTARFMRYEEYFKDKNVEIVYFPYTRSTNSTQIRNMIASSQKTT